MIYMNRDFLRKITLLGFHLLGAALVILLIVSMFVGSPIINSESENAESVRLTPKSTVGVKDGVNEVNQQFEYDLSKVEISNKSLIFYTCHQNIQVYADDREIYSLSKSGGMFGGTTGARWNYVDIPSGTVNMKVCLQAVYSQYPMSDFYAYVGNARQDILHKIRGSLLNILLIISIVVIGVFLVVFWLYERKTVRKKKTMLYFGFLAITTGLWCFSDTEVAMILLKNNCAQSFMAFVFLMLIPIFYLKYVSSYLYGGKRSISDYIVLACILNMFICIPLHLFGIIALKQTAVITHILLFSAVIYQLFALITRARERGMDYTTWVNLIGIGVIVTASLVELNNYYKNLMNNQEVIHFGILFAVFTLGLVALRDAKRNIEQIKEVSVYKKMALKDIQTGMLNRNAYDRWLYSEKIFDNLAIIVYDVNNLKQCNDLLGHEAGDRLIKQAADLIKTVFGTTGEHYRIGGDEFCTVLKNVTKEYIVERLNLLDDLQDSVGDKNSVSTLSLASGYAFYNNKLDLDLEKTRKRADLMLYENKELMKKKMSNR